ncbi:MAG: hypothetical protein ACRDH7_13405 [Actinomycetota bacterium]
MDENRSVESEAHALHDAASSEGVPLRLIGSIAVRHRSPQHVYLMSVLGRRGPRDVDLVTYARHEKSVEGLFVARGYLLDPAVRHSREWGIKRLIFLHPSNGTKVDVFLDELVMAHTIDFVGRLELDAPTVTLADLLLSKLQIHEITENDLIDLAVMLAEHDPAEGADLDLGRVVSVLADDWGFQHTAEANLAKLLAAAMGRWPDLPDAVRERVSDRVRGMEQALEVSPKSRRWKLRARVGERLRWYEEVGEVER